MAAHKFVTDVATPLLESDKLSNLRLRPSALYELGRYALAWRDHCKTDIDAILRESRSELGRQKAELEILKQSPPSTKQPPECEKVAETEVGGNVDIADRQRGDDGDTDDPATSTKDADGRRWTKLAKGKDEQSSGNGAGRFAQAKVCAIRRGTKVTLLAFSCKHLKPEKASQPDPRKSTQQQPCRLPIWKQLRTSCVPLPI